MPDLPITTDDLIPHIYPMKMVDRIISYDDTSKSSQLELTVDKKSPFVTTGGTLDAESFLEIIAQAAAAQHGFNLKRDGTREERGFLVAARDLKIDGQAEIGDKLTIKVQCGTEIESISSVFGSIHKNEEEIASATISVWHGNKEST